MITTADKIKQILEQQPNKYKQVEIARLLSVSRERVRQLVNKLKLKHLLITKRPVLCANCEEELHYKKSKSGLCRYCLKILRQVIVQCDDCQRLIIRTPSHINLLNFCDNHCEGRYMAKTYNFGRNKVGVK